MRSALADIRKAQTPDLPRLNALMQGLRAYEGNYRRIIENYAVAETQLARDLVYLAEDGDRLLGFYSLIVGSEPELDLMFVADDAQGMGLGKRLLDHMREQARAAGVRSVLIVAHPPALAFYERMGAVRTGTKPASGRIDWDRPILRLDVA